MESNVLKAVEEISGYTPDEMIAMYNDYGRMATEWEAYSALGTVEELSALKERTRWIPCSERLPEDVGSYLIYYHEWSNGDFLPKYDDYRIRVMRFMNNGKWCMPVCTDKRCEADTNREVTHWRKLPQPPQKGRRSMTHYCPNCGCKMDKEDET